MTTETVKGFKEFTGEEALKRERIKDILIKNFKLFGFQPAENPLIEYEDFVRGENSNDEAVSEIFKLSDRGERKLALRYELTFQLKRIMQNKKLPYKRYEIGPVFRDEPTTGNRFRQFTQCDIDIISSSVKEEAEILALAAKNLEELGINSIIYVNNRKLMNEILEEAGVKPSQIAEVIREIDKMDKLSETEVKDNLKKYKAEKLIDIFKKPEKFFAKYPAYQEIIELKKACDYYDINVTFLPTLARGLSYYNSSVFEIKTKEMKESICGGGSYMFNNIQSTGISFGLERLSTLSKLDLEQDSYLIISIGQDKEAIKIAEKMRKKNLSCTIMYGKISKALDYANSYNINKVIFLGEDEVKKGKLKIRDMKTGKEIFSDVDKLVK